MLEGIIACVVLLVVQLVLLHLIDRRLDYAEMNSHYMRSTTSGKRTGAPRKRQAAANDDRLI